MSFSSEVNEELVKKTDSARHCQIAEFAAFMGMSGNVSEENYVWNSLQRTNCQLRNSVTCY